MCTAIAVKTTSGNTFLGRTMDFSYVLEPELYVAPKGCEWNNILDTHKIRNRYSVLGIGQELSPVVFSDGVNEMGFGAAALYFPGFAEYDPAEMQGSNFQGSNMRGSDPGRNALPPVAAIEIVKFLLGLCADVGQAVSMLRSIRIVGVEDSITGTIAPLHWILADKSGKCITVERTAEGLNFMDNSIGVLANSPDFQWHMTNLRNFMNVKPVQEEEGQWGMIKLTPFGQGAGTIGLPGDWTSPSRFARAAYLKSHTHFPEGRKEAVAACFHVMESVSVPKGAVVTSRNTNDYTQYTAFADLSSVEYFFRTYDNSMIVCAGIPGQCRSSNRIISLGKLTRPIEFGSIFQG